MATVNLTKLGSGVASKPILDVLGGSTADKTTVSNALNGALKTVLTNSATKAQQTALVNLLQSLSPADLVAEQNLSLRDFVAKNTTLPTDAAAKQAAEAAIATLSSTTTVGALLGLNGTIATNPALSGIVAQTNLSALLGTSPSLSTDQLQTDFIAKYTSFTGTTQEFWTQLGQDAEFKALVPELQFTMQLGVLTLNNAPLVTALRNNYKPASPRDLTKLDANALTQLINSRNIAIPDGIPGSTPAEKTSSYVGGIIALLQAAFPTDYVAQGLAASKDTTQQSVAKFLSNSPDFDFQTTSIDSYIQQNSAKSFLNIGQGQVPAVTTQLKRIQRVFRISPDFSTINTLVGAGLDSAAKISKVSRTNFVKQYSAALGGDAQALDVYTKAQHINAQTAFLYRKIQGGLNEVTPVAIGHWLPPVPQPVQTGIPNWQTLFGSTSGCQCDDCLSVYSPAAYFVDLLEFLRNSPANVAGFTPLEVLIGATHGSTTITGRRPDLPFIKLNCQNTNTELPYIDLVNEILESYITIPNQLNSKTAHDTPLDATTQELSVNPEYTNDAAYTQLSAASYPLTLPYDRFLDIARRYLGFLGGTRLQVIQSFQTAQAPVDTAAVIAAEVLGLSYEEFQLIGNWDYQQGKSANLPPLYKLYGYDSQNITRTVGSGSVTQSFEQWLANVQEFLQRTGLQFSDLVNMLETQFNNPGQTITLSSKAPCDITQTTITPLTDTTLTNILPFLRLWTKLGWSMSDLDTVLAVFAPSSITRGFLLALAQVKQLQSTLNLTLAQLLPLWGLIGTDGRESPYITLFQNKAVLNPVDPNLQLAYRAALATAPTGLPPSSSTQISYDAANKQLVFVGAMTDAQWADLIVWAAGDASKLLAVQNLYEMRWAKGTELAATTASITSEATAILAALRISSDDLNVIRTAANLLDTPPPTPVQTPVNLANLSLLYRYAILAQSLGLAVSDLVSLISLTGIKPFQLASTDPVTDQTFQFVQAAQKVLASRFSVAQLNFIYRAISNPAAGVGPLETNVDVLVMTIQTGLEKIAAANAFSPDPNGKLLRQKLGVLLASSDLSAAMDLISGGAVYKASLAALPPGVSFTGALAGVVSYDGANQLLMINGPMSDTVKGLLVLMSSDGAYQSAINNLYQQPRNILANDLSFLNKLDATTKLINTPSTNVGDSYNYVLQALLSYLTDAQSRSLVKQALSQALSLDAATTSLLLDTGAGTTTPALLNSQRDPSQPAIVDILDARDGGLLATYFSDVNLTVPTATQIDPTVNVGAAGETVTNPGGARWVGKVLPQFSESYTFYVSANDGVRLWVNDQLLIDQWTSQPFSTRTSPSLNLNAGQLYDIRLDYFNTSAAGTAVLAWSSKSTNNNVNILIPETALFPANTFATLFRLYPIALLLSTFGMKAGDVAYLSSHASDFVGVDPGNSANKVNFDLTKLPVDRSNAAAVDKQAVAFFNQWLQLNDLYTLRSALPSGNVTLFDVFRVASSSTTPAQLSSTIVSTVLAATGWDAKEFATLAGKATVSGATVGFGLTDADFRNVEGQQGTGLVRLKSCLDLSGRLGISTSQLFLWGNVPPSADQAQDIKNTVKAKYDDTTWITVGAPLNNQIRESSKAALIAYVLNMSSILSLGFTSADQLYEYFLIDVEMSSCRLTSRIVQATAAVQLFIQRCLLNLENDNSGANAVLNVPPENINYEQWQWRQNYRVWEANREVFLYPENYIDPTLRDNATPFFQDLQNEMQKGDITADRAEQAFQDYLKKVQEVARLEICGIYWEYDTDSNANITHDIYHVFGRTFATPHVYYYRNFDNTAQVWSPWEEVTADVEGDHLIPVIWNRRLHIFWPIFQEQTTPNTAVSSSGIPVPPVSTGATGTVAHPTPPLKNLQVQLAWSEYRDGGWTKKQATQNFLIPAGYFGYSDDFDAGNLLFRALTNEDQLTVGVFDAGPSRPYYGDLLGSFTFGSCSSIPDVVGGLTVPAIGADHWPMNASLHYESLTEDHRFPASTDPTYGTLTLVSSDSDNPGPVTPVPVLQATPSRFELMYPQQFFSLWEVEAPDSVTGGLAGQPFFYADDTHTYLVNPEFFEIPVVVRDPGSSVVGYTAAQLSDTAAYSALPNLPIFEQQALSRTGGLASIAGSGVSIPASGSVTRLTGTSAATNAAVPLAIVPPSAAGPVSTRSFSGAASKFATWNKSYFETVTDVDFFVHRHPHVCEFLKALNWQGVDGLLTLDNQKLGLKDVEPNTIFQNSYKPTNVVAHPYPSENVDFSTSGAYSIYNWEIFFHIPLLMATLLSRNQQFDDAEKWFRYIFNPTSNSTDPIPSRYWNVLPFYQDTEPDRIGDLVTALEYTGSSDANLLQEKADFTAQITQWEQKPFDPDLIARMRIVAYQKTTVMKYMDHHLAWADNLYAQYTTESVNEATLHYVMIDEILGDRPIIMPTQGVVLDQTYNQLATAPGLDAFSDKLVTLENLFPFSTDNSSSTSDGSGSSTAAGVAEVPYFCIPLNDTLLGYWDKVAQRLNQIRHCQNISGQFQQLPLFAPPINPALLIQALAMGMDLSSALSDINAATPYYRFSYMLPKALELCGEVRALGAALLSALEKSDAEAMAMLRATQETSVMKAIRNVKQQQLNEANANLAALNDSLAVTTNRQQYYQDLISSGLTSNETQQISEFKQAQSFQTDAQSDESQAGQIAMMPDMEFGANGAGGSPIASITFGSRQFVAKYSSDSRVSSEQASYHSTSASMFGISAAWERRGQEWAFQSQTANLEITQINDQIKAATARVAFAQADLDNQDLLISNASDVEDFLRNKYTNQALYDWMVSQVSAVYFQCYQMAYDLAKRAEACFVFERMPDMTNYSPFIQFGYWDSLKKGLLSGERLYQDLKRLEIAYMDQNQRDFEITKSISLLLLDPVALINLKETGQCTVQLPEALFDMDYPGHYLRRIKNLSLTIPCVVGAYTSVNCTLTMVSNKVRIDNNSADSKDYLKDSHFLINLAASQSIATSTAQNDSGLFTVNFNDERYLPFEGAGVISTLQLSMPQDTNAFDFETISDVIFNLKYTARDGGAALRSNARGAAVLPPGGTPGASLTGQTPMPAQAGLTRMFSLRHEFPTDWYNFLNPLAASADQTMILNLGQERFPFRYRGKKIQIYEVDVFLIFRDIYDPTTYTADGTPLGDYAAKGAAGALVVNVTPPKGAARTTQLVSNNALLQRVPYGTIPQPAPPPAPPVPPAIGTLGAWNLTVKGTDIQQIASTLQNQVASGGSTFYRMNPNVVEDVYLVCHFSTG